MAETEKMSAWWALSLTAPWDLCIIDYGKRLENRRWNTTFRGDFLLHRAKGCSQAEYNACGEFVRNAFGPEKGGLIARTLPPRNALRFGGIVGVSKLVDVLPMAHSLSQLAEAPSGYDARWRMLGQHAFALSDVERLGWADCRGLQRFFRVPQRVVDALSLKGRTPGDFARPEAWKDKALAQVGLFGGRNA